MLIPNHPHDERLSALASGDPEAVADLSLSEHVAFCQRCTDTVAELGALRASLAELPDLRPHRPLQLLPPVTDAHSRVDRVGGWARRFFAPVLTAGAALAMVGLVGTTAPLLGGMAGQSGGDAATEDIAEQAPAAATAHDRLNAGAADASESPDLFSGATDGAGAEDFGGEQPLESDSEVAGAPEVATGSDEREAALTERSVWPMLLFTGVAIMVAAALLRWIFVPRVA